MRRGLPRRVHGIRRQGAKQRRATRNTIITQHKLRICRAPGPWRQKLGRPWSAHRHGAQEHAHAHQLAPAPGARVGLDGPPDPVDGMRIVRQNSTRVDTPAACAPLGW
jgi:hypothetical protein